VAGLTALAAVLALMSFAPSVLDGRGTTGIFVTDGGQEWTAYKAAQRFMYIVQDYDSPGHRVFLWFPGEFGYVSLTWTDLPQDADTLNQPGVPEGLTALTPLARARLSLPSVKFVMILSPSAHELAVARQALASGGFPAVLVRSGELAKNSLSYALVELGR
jgi:hypothetical protein